MADHLTSHHGGGWKYQFHIPVILRAAAGRNKRGKPMTAFVRYIQRCPRREAELLAKRWALIDATEIAALRSLSVDERKVLETGGGWNAIRNSPDYLNDVTVDESTGRTIIQTP